MTCIIDSQFYDLLVYLSFFQVLYCEVVNSEYGGVSNVYFFNARGGVKYFHYRGGIFFQCYWLRLKIKILKNNSLLLQILQKKSKLSITVNSCWR